jgi:hypothetical protein
MSDSGFPENIGSVHSRWRPFVEAKSFARSLGFVAAKDYRAWAKTAARPADIPPDPDKVYANDWDGWPDWLGTAPRPFAEAREFARSLGLNTRDEWVAHVAEGSLPRDVPKWPQNIYKGQGWISWEDWLGRRAGFRFRPFDEAREFVRSLGLKSRREWTAFVQSDACPRDIPSDPAGTYSDRWLGFGDWLGNHTRWNRNAILAFLKSLRPIVQDLQPAEVFVLLQRKGLIGKKFPTNTNAAILMSLDRLCSAAAPEATIEQLTVHLEGAASDPIDKAAESSSEGSAASLVDDELAPVEAAELATPTSLPRLRSTNSLKIPDQLIAEHVIDDEEILEFLVNNRVAALWQEALDGDPEQLIGRLRGEAGGGDYFQRICERFAAQYAGAVGLPIPADYSFRKHGRLQPPNLMQRLAAYRLMTEKRLGNWSGVGAGKTLSAVLASRLVGAQLTVVVAVNATIDRWEEAIRDAFPNSHVHAKDVPAFSIDASRPNYLLLNFESFQQVWSDQFVQDLTTEHKIDFVVLDEVQSVRQRTAEAESKRRSLVRRLLTEAATRNPDLRVLGMSATPVINNLHEAKTLLELVIGDELHDLPTKPTVDNAIRVHQKLILHGIRYRPRYSATLLTSHPEIDGHSLVSELRQVRPRDLLGLETVLLKAKLPSILAQVRPGTMLYTQFVTGVVDPVREACEQHGLRVGVFTGEEKAGLNAFRGGDVDVLIGSAPVGTGVDGLQDVCNRLIFISLPWTSAEYEQVVGRLHRHGTQFGQIEVIVPQVVLRHPDGREWSWDKLRWERIQWKRTLADAATDGVVPQGQLPSKEEMQAQSLAALTEWMNRLECDGRIDGVNSPPEST